mmetsp:Transcript_29520/g.68414  ORF Transcript_29520/g.68414 Transcript_29520/m.68414 type:complete len:272 (-) Transcript_29520:3574-4389(-)
MRAVTPASSLNSMSQQRSAAVTASTSPSHTQRIRSPASGADRMLFKLSRMLGGTKSNAMSPSSSVASGSAPRSSKSSSTFPRPSSAARCRGVCPRLVRAPSQATPGEGCGYRCVWACGALPAPAAGRSGGSGGGACSSSTAIVCRLPDSSAQCMGVRATTLLLLLGRALCASSNLVMPTLVSPPLLPQLRCSGVRPEASHWLSSEAVPASTRSSSSLTLPTEPQPAAMCSAVRPSSRWWCRGGCMARYEAARANLSAFMQSTSASQIWRSL